MKIIDNTSLLLGDDLKATLGRGAEPDPVPWTLG